MTELYDDFPTAAQCVAAKWQHAVALRERATEFLNGPVRTALIDSAYACTWISVPLPDAITSTSEQPFVDACGNLLRAHGYKSVLLNGHSLELRWA